MMQAKDYQKYKLLPPTPPDIEGPFYKAGAPLLTDGFLPGVLNKDCMGKNLTVSGYVSNVNGEAIAGALLDIWQANATGVYDNDGYNLRGKILSSGNYESVGVYIFNTIIPGDYDISEPTDPQPHEFRCAHIHFKLSAMNYKSLTTQLYFPVDPYNATDHWFSILRVINFVGDDYSKGTFNFVLEKEN
jgi:protocatechuate 3,4-dioxygenase beta subunit